MESFSKICPLTGKEPEQSWCYYYDCLDVTPDKYEIYKGEKYRCTEEKNKIERKYKKEKEREREDKEFNNSFNLAKTVDLEQFFKICNEIDDYAKSNRQEYNENLKIHPFHTPEQRILVYLFEGNEIKEISAVDNIFSFLGKNFNTLKNQNPMGAISYCVIPSDLAEAINVCLYLKYKKDTKNLLKYENPIYVKGRVLAKYIKAAYGLSWDEFYKIHKKHLEITEIANYDNILYLKPELDKIIQREIYIKMQETEKIIKN